MTLRRPKCTFCGKHAKGELRDRSVCNHMDHPPGECPKRTSGEWGIGWPICGPCLRAYGRQLSGGYYHIPTPTPETERDYRGPKSLLSRRGKRPKGTALPPKPRHKTPVVTSKTYPKQVFDFRHKRVQHKPKEWQPYGLRDEEGEEVKGPILVPLPTMPRRRGAAISAARRAAHNLGMAMLHRFDGSRCKCKQLIVNGVIKYDTSKCPRHRRLRQW